jgi:hypothetical protein
MGIVDSLIYFAVAFLCVYVAGQLATQRGRSRKGWVWASALLGPLPLLILVLMPRKAGAHHA